MSKVKQPETKPRKKLEVRKQSIRQLSPEDLKQVAGGGYRPTATGNCYK